MCAYSCRSPLIQWHCAVPSDLRYLPELRQLAQAQLSVPWSDCPRALHFPIVMVVHELVLNAMTHAHVRDVRRLVTIEWTVRPGRCCCRVTDRGKKFAFPTRRTRLTDEAAESGRGLFLVQRLSHTVRWRRLPRGNCCEVQWRWVSAKK